MPDPFEFTSPNPTSSFEALAPTLLSLTTPSLIRQGLALLGLDWQPTHVPSLGTKGLYVWIDGKGEAPYDRRGVLYVGSGISDDGVWDRIKYEQSVADREHAHGRAITRRGAIPIGGPVTRQAPEPEFWEALEHENLLQDNGSALLRSWLNDPDSNPHLQAEKIAIRLCIWLGEVGAPVNSQYAGAWANDKPEDWAAAAVAYWMWRGN